MSNNRRVLFALALLAALTGCARGVEDPGKTRLFTSFLTDILANEKPSGILDPQMDAALTPEQVAAIRGSYASLGAFKGLQFLGEDRREGYRRYHYRATFADGTQGEIFVLDSNGKIAGFFKE